MDDELLRKSVAHASAGTYDPTLMKKLGYEVTVNVGNPTKRFINYGKERIVPDVVVWQPYNINSTSGQSITVEKIETPESLKNPDIRAWSIMSSLKSNFNLIVPVECLELVQNLILNNGLDHLNVQTYEYNRVEGRFSFKTEIRYGLR